MALPHWGAAATQPHSCVYMWINHIYLVNASCVCYMQSFHLTLLTSSDRNFSSESDITVILSSKGVTASDVVFGSPSQKISHATGLMCSSVETKIPHLGLLELGFAGYLGSYTTANRHRVSQDNSWCSPEFVQTHHWFQHSQQIRSKNLATTLDVEMTCLASHRD